MRDTLVILPTYNEAENLRTLVESILALDDDLGVLVVDDNSADGTGDLADALRREHDGRVDVLHRDAKLGLGSAYVAGFELALQGNARRVVTMDADLSHQPKHIPDLLAFSASEGCDLVIGSRYVPGGSTPDVPWSRKLLSGGANLFAHALIGLRARDATSGFRCYRREALEALPLDEIVSNGSSFLVEVLFLIQHRGFKVGEIPITFLDRTRGESKISGDEIFKAIHTVGRLALHRLTQRRLTGSATRDASSASSASSASAERGATSQEQPREPSMRYVEVNCNLCGSRERIERFQDTRSKASSSGGQGDPSDWSALCCTSSGYGIHPPIVRCAQCGLLYANPQPRAEDLIDRYSAVEDPLYVAERKGRELTFARHLDAFEKHTGLGPGHRIVDIGAYVGVFVELAAGRGWAASGLEPSRWAAAYAQDRGLDVVRGSLDDRPFEPSSFDAVTLWDVIEHVADPLETLRQALGLLRPGGWIAVHTMDSDSLMARMTGKRWPWLMEMHLVYFSRRTLSAMLVAAGFEQVEVLVQGRYLRLAYLLTRLRRLSPGLARAAAAVARWTRIGRLAVPVNFGDLVTAYARRPAAGSTD